MGQPVICTIEEKLLVGMHTQTTLAVPTTANMWKAFMPRKKFIPYQKGKDVLAVQIYPSDFYIHGIAPTKEFVSCATVEVSKVDSIPEGMGQRVIPEGLYAVFIHKGVLAGFNKTAQYIFTEWIPASKYEVDDRPHFEVLGEKYLGIDNSASEEEVWVPLRLKSN